MKHLNIQLALMVLLFTAFFACKPGKTPENIDNTDSIATETPEDDPDFNYTQTIIGNKHVVKNTKELKSFDSLLLKGAFHVLLIPSDTAKLILETDENLHAYISAENNGKTLKIKATQNLKDATKLNLQIYFTNIASIEAIGAASIKINDTLANDTVSLRTYGAASINAAIKANFFKLEMEGGSQIFLKGKTNKASYKVIGAGLCMASDLSSDSTSVLLEGAGSASVSAKKQLDATINGIGVIKYRGTPASFEKKISGLGKVVKII